MRMNCQLRLFLILEIFVRFHQSEGIVLLSILLSALTLDVSQSHISESMRDMSVFATDLSMINLVELDRGLRSKISQESTIPFMEKIKISYAWKS